MTCRAIIGDGKDLCVSVHVRVSREAIGKRTWILSEGEKIDWVIPEATDIKTQACPTTE